MTHKITKMLSIFLTVFFNRIILGQCQFLITVEPLVSGQLQKFEKVVETIAGQLEE